jgi:aryl-phospho-beta-D-glucosidase BglC (GH1 family)
VIGWLAVVAFCLPGECNFFADTRTPYSTKEACEEKVNKVIDELNELGIEVIIPGCIPIRFNQI